jgi:hypothetical protein
MWLSLNAAYDLQLRPLEDKLEGRIIQLIFSVHNTNGSTDMMMMMMMMMMKVHGPSKLFFSSRS